MSLLARFRQACRTGPRGPADAGDARGRQGPDQRLGLNRAFLSGVLAEDPRRDKDRNGDPVLLLIVAFPAPDTREGRPGLEPALQEIEVPEEVAGRHRGELRLGESVFVTGPLSGGGGIIATEVHSGPPPDGAERA
jgi:hypothetical protein